VTTIDHNRALEPLSADRLDALARVGLSWQPSGQVALRGPLLRLAEDCDRAFARLAGIWGAEQERYPASLPARSLQRVDYLRSFPHQATFATTLSREEANLGDFLAGPVLDEAGNVALTELAAVCDVLNPAACYHLYNGHQGQSLDGPMYLTTVNTCFRQETHYVPLRRLHSFTMREIVCMGTGEEVAAFVWGAKAALNLFVELVDLPLEWLAATDPFFQARSNPRYLLQVVQPVKYEATYGGDLAIASANTHHDHFGVGFDLTRDGKPAHSGCLAFGVERWLFAITHRHGTDPAHWPAMQDAAEQVHASVLGQAGGSPGAAGEVLGGAGE
jgi:seryl-tRNA synthetase